MRGTECDIHGHSDEPFRYGDRMMCWECESKALAALEAVQRVRELHAPWTSETGTWCEHCEDVFDASIRWPCSTIKALDGAE